MKKTLLALAVAATATTVNAAEVFKSEDGSVNFYGQLRQELKLLDDQDPTLSSGSSRVGVDAAYKVNDDFKVVGLVEISVREDKDMYVRQHQIGFETATAGSFRFGKAFTISDDVYGADYSYFFGGTALRYGTLSGAEHSSQIKYAYENEAFWVKAAYGLPEDNKEQELAEIFAGKSFGDLAVHVGGGVNTDKNFVGRFDLTNTYFEGTAEYTFGKALVGFTYYNATLEDNKNSHEINENAFSLAGTYNVADKTTVYAGLEYTEQDPNFRDKEDGTVFYAGVEYKFASWARVYAEYGYADGTTLGYTKDEVLIKGSTVDSENNFGIGARVYW
ncbi:porin [Vibrio campbellii]|uniref:porin n=1 Tax=Vibrio campbellii TaxID=680 RepID=UPI00210A2708|nr:porin [Vibrio campbellii]UTZ36973.1 porin [Vibrio campbellii]